MEAIGDIRGVLVVSFRVRCENRSGFRRTSPGRSAAQIEAHLQ